MRLPPVDYQAPETLDQALTILNERGPAAAVLAGGTDLVVRLRQRLVTADTMVSLKNISELKTIRQEGVTLIIGAAASLRDVIDHPVVQQELPALALALESVGSPDIQHRQGTIGGNLLCNTRCIYYNQSGWWRSGLEHCFKDGGQVCHCLPDSKECTSGCQSDGVVMLTALSAQATIKSSKSERTVPVGQIFSGKGEAPFTLAADELITDIRIFLPAPGTGMSYQKLRWRSAVDYPLMSAAAVVTFSQDNLDRVRLVLGTAGPAPLVIDEAEKILRGKPPTPELIAQAASAARKKAEGLIVENTIAPAEYRRKMAEILARRALAEAVKR
jgi:4-hydroxybenzoyl-CoA reductase subunit beta